MRYLMIFSYDGSNFYGYQKQPNKRTIQQTIEYVLKHITNNIINIHASGRTDALVHAINQKAHFDYNGNMNETNIKNALNSLLPKDIYIKSIIKVDNNFHARFNVKFKEYYYKINIGNYDPINRNYIYQYNKQLNIKEMKRALKCLRGTHNFKSFTKANDLKKLYVRTIYNTSLIIKDNIITIYFKGNGFMRYQVRNMVGLLIEIGQGKKKSSDIIKIMDACDRTKSGITAPPQGLYLKDVFYK